MRQFVYILVCLLLLVTNGVCYATVTNCTTTAQAVTAFSTASPGDTIILADGTYTSENFDFSGTGTEAAPITFRPQTLGGAIFTGVTNIEITGTWLVMDGFNFEEATAIDGDTPILGIIGGDYCRITNCSFIDCGEGGNDHIYFRCIYLTTTATYNRVDHNYFEGSTYISIQIQHQDTDVYNYYNTIDHNYFKDIVQLGTNDCCTGILTGPGGVSDQLPNYTTIEYNLFDNVDADPEMISNKSSNNIIRYNTFQNSDAMLSLRGGNNVLVDGNFLLNNLNGIRIHGENHVIINNYIYGMSSTGIVVPKGGENYGATSNCTIAHNTIVNSTLYGMRLGQNFGTSGPYKDAEDDVFFKNVVLQSTGTMLYEENALVDPVWTDNVVYGTATQGYTDSGIANTDPGIASDGTVYRISSAESAAVDYSSAVAGVDGDDYDMDGQARDSDPDVGADEWVVGGEPRGILTAADVGPSWVETGIHGCTIVGGTIQ